MEINLHTHTNYSDGTLSPKELVLIAEKRGLSHLSVTDHDIISATAQAKEAAKSANIKFISGVELSTIDHDNLHILGYGIDENNQKLLDKISDYRSRRIKRIEKIFEKLKNLGFDISLEELEISDKTTFGRPHIALLMKKKGLAATRKEAFQKYLGFDMPAYVPPMGPTVKEGIEDIKEAGGLAFLAHPGTAEGFYDIAKYKQWGLDGIEAFYPTHSNNRTRHYLKIAQDFSLLVSAGSDFHGPGTDRDNIKGFPYDERLFSWADKLAEKNL